MIEWDALDNITVAIIGLIGLLLVANRRLRLEARLNAEKELISSRQKAYEKLWHFLKVTSPVRVNRGDELTKEQDLIDLLDNLLNWYHDCGQGMHLSNKALLCYECLIYALLEENRYAFLEGEPEDKEKYREHIRDMAQGLRRITKESLSGVDNRGNYIRDLFGLSVKEIDCAKDDPCGVERNKRKISDANIMKKPKGDSDKQPQSVREGSSDQE